MVSDKNALITYPKIINHIAVSVPDLDEAVKWYTKVLGFTVIRKPIEIVVDNSLIGRAVKDIHGPRIKKMRMAWLSTANQVGFEIIEYVEPRAEKRADNFEYWKSGITHFCITDPNIEDVCKKIVDAGGKLRTEIWGIVPGKGYKIAFCEDPFGNILEIYNQSYDQIISSL
jgi:catechol 2,3-dioxygenase-like lactoylglutathione lyase family enzyme